MPLNT